MAILGIKLPDEVARKLSKLVVPGEKVPMSESHITLLYLGNDVSIDAIGKIIIATARLTERFAPFRASLREITSFQRGDEGTYPVICPVLGQGIRRLHDELQAVCDEMGVEWSKKFPTYKPHVTLSYSPDEPERTELEDPVTWTCRDMVLWGGDEGQHRIATVFEFLGN